MGPKKGKGDKKGKEDEKMTKSQYLAKIAELNASLAQAKKDAYEIEGTYLATDKKYEQLQEDMTDIVKYLEHEIKVCNEEIARHDVTIDRCTKEIKKHKKYYDEIFARMDEEYETKKRGLMEKIQSVSAKLNSFEEIRRQREDFLRRGEELVALVEEMDDRHKQEVYEAEKQIIIKQDKLQQEMENRLAQLAMDFREATDVRIGETTNRILGDNIKLGNMLTCQQDLLTNLKENYTNIKKIQRHAELDLELKEGEYKMTFERYAQHSGKIESLLDTIEGMTNKIEILRGLIKVNRRLKRKIIELECYLRDLQDEYSTLVKSLEEIDDLTARAKKTLSNSQKYLMRLLTSLFEAAKKVKESIDHENATMGEIEELARESDLPDNAELQDEVKEKSYKFREQLIEDILVRLQIGMITYDDFHVISGPSDHHDINFSYRSSMDFSQSLASKRSEAETDTTIL